jgi:alkaline phosphatase
MKRKAVLFLGTTLFLTAPGAVQAQTIYPLNRAEILSGSKFDLKVEFPGAPPAAAIRVSINGTDAASAVGGSASVVEREDGGDYSAFWIRDAVLTKPGRYVVEAAAADRTASVTWEVFNTPGARAKNIILFIGDGMTIAHRTAARILSKALSRADTAVNSPWTTCRIWRWSRPPAQIRW